MDEEKKKEKEKEEKEEKEDDKEHDDEEEKVDDGKSWLRLFFKVLLSIIETLRKTRLMGKRKETTRERKKEGFQWNSHSGHYTKTTSDLHDPSYVFRYEVILR